ncbi:MAG: V-type ATPase 116kDa subunit family protein [Nitrososphaerales archaeon]
MPVARLSKATLRAPKRELGILFMRLMEFGEFHPTKNKNFVQDTNLLILATRAQSIYSKAGDLIARLPLRPKSMENGKIEEFSSLDVQGLIHQFEDYLTTLEEVEHYEAGDFEIKSIRNLLHAIREASSIIFSNLQKIVVFQNPDKSLTLEGFIPSKLIKTFTERIGSSYIVSIHSLDRMESNDPYVPSLWINPRTVSLFETLTLERGLPKYNEIDPTPIIAFVFPVLFGIMFGDVGHGIVLVVLGLYLILRTKYTYWGQLMIVLGISAFIVGFIRGSFFGVDFSTTLTNIIPLPEVLRASFTLSYIPLLLEVAIIIGTFHLASAYGIAFINQIRCSNYADAFLSRLPTLVLYASIVPFGLAVAGTDLQLGTLFASKANTPVFSQLLNWQIPVSVVATYSLPVVLLSLSIIILGHPLKEYSSSHKLKKTIRALGSGLLEGITRPFEFFMNTLSYVRLGVLLITTTLLGSLIAGVLTYGILGILLAVFLNVILLSMEGLIVYIQDMRLHLYEWLSKFYIGTGTPFTPLVASGKFARLVFGAQTTIGLSAPNAVTS